jgi:hypothetical protein
MLFKLELAGYFSFLVHYFVEIADPKPEMAYLPFDFAYPGHAADIVTEVFFYFAKPIALPTKAIYLYHLYFFCRHYAGNTTRRAGGT